MSRAPVVKSNVAANFPAGPPFVGALLRWSLQATRRRVLEALEKRGMSDVNESHLIVFSHPPPDGIRPIDLADRAGTTKQAMNYLLGQMAALGYVERRAKERGGQRLVYLTRRGWQVCETIWGTMQQIESEWAATLGKRRFDEFMSALRQLSQAEANGNHHRQGDRRTSNAATTDSP